MKERHDTWSRRKLSFITSSITKSFVGIEDATKERIKHQKLSQAQPLNYLDPLIEQLDSIESRSSNSGSSNTSASTSTRPDLLNPHLKRVVSSRGRKMTLKKEQDQFMKVLGHPAFKSNPLGAIGMHLTNTINQIKMLPKKNN